MFTPLKGFEYKDNKLYRGSSEHGRSTVVVECPFCGNEVEAYIWSLAGSGKKCPECGAVHTRLGYSRKKIDNN